jgi:hypothetical protein
MVYVLEHSMQLYPYQRILKKTYTTKSVCICFWNNHHRGRKALSWICIDMICSHHDIAEILLKLLLNINQSIFSWLWSLRCERHLYYLAFTVFGLECPRWWLFQKHIHTDLVVYVFFNIRWYGYSCIECSKTYGVNKSYQYISMTKLFYIHRNCP